MSTCLARLDGAASGTRLLNSEGLYGIDPTNPIYRTWASHHGADGVERQCLLLVSSQMQKERGVYAASALDISRDRE